MKILIDQGLAEQIQTLAEQGEDSETNLVNDLLEEALAARKAGKQVTELGPEVEDPIVAEYLANNGSRCPYCESDSIEADANQGFDGPDAWCEVECLSCRGKWTDHYKLHNVSLDNGPDLDSDDDLDDDEDGDDE